MCNNNKAERRISIWTSLGNRKKTWNLKVSYTNYHWFSWYSHQRFCKRTRGLGNKRTNGDNPNYSIVEIGQNTEKSPGDLRLVVTQTPGKNILITLL